MRRRLRRLAPLAAALAAALAAQATRAQDAAPAEDAGSDGGDERAPVAPPAPPPPAPPPDQVDGENWLDVGHAFVEERVFAPVLRLDRFFSDERDIEAERSRSFLRWRSEVRFSQHARPAFTTGVRANLRLPGLNKQLRRLRVVIAGETRDAIDALFPPDPEEQGADAETADEDLGTGDAGLRFFLWDTLRSHADLGGGILVRLPPGAYGRLRLRWAVPVSSLFLTRSALSGFWRTDTRFGTSAALDLERPISSRVVARLGGNATLSEVSRGIEWGSELAVLAYLSTRAAAQVGVTVSGAREATPRVDVYRAYARFRRDFYRRWIFFELEPEASWPWTPERGRHAAWGLALRLEVQFRGNEAPPRPPPPPPPEPKDPPPLEPEEPTPAEPTPAEPPEPLEPLEPAEPPPAGDDALPPEGAAG